MTEAWPWLTLALLGAYHGVNPAMGWLFAVALGLQEKRLGAVLQALPPIALGHAAAVAVTVALIGAAQLVVAPTTLRYLGAGVLIFFGIYKFLRRSHPRWVGMRVGFGDLTVWSFLMASAHGAGLMLLPVLFRISSPPAPADHSVHANHLGPAAAIASVASADLLAVGIHTMATFLVMTLIALLVYQKLGLMLLTRSWFNLDLLWAGTLIAAGIITLVF